MTNPVSGGLSEQGPQVYPDLTDEQIEEIALILDEPQLKRLHGGILALSLSYVAAVQEAPRAIRQLRAALARPRPVLPADELLEAARAVIEADEDWDLNQNHLTLEWDDVIDRLKRAVRGPALPAPEPPRLELSGISEEEWGMLAEMKPPALRAALMMLAKAQANGDA